ncbi:MAG: AzlC family ABC transporter permease [Candidatus Promineifilaceae bacterium]
MSPTRLAFLAGVKAELPILLGVLPFGMIYGVLAIEAGLPIVQAQAMSAVVFAGSAQFVITQLVTIGSPALVIIVTAVLVNLRHTLYSASLAPYLRHLRPRWQWLLAYLLTDEAYAVAVRHYQEGREIKYKHWYFLGAGLALWTTWQFSTAAGILLGAQIPSEWSLDFTLALTFIAIVVPALKERADLAAALTGGITAVLLVGLPYKLGLVIGALFGITVGVLVDRYSNENAYIE